jgi:hypothetical protein
MSGFISFFHLFAVNYCIVFFLLPIVCSIGEQCSFSQSFTQLWFSEQIKRFGGQEAGNRIAAFRAEEFDSRTDSTTSV